MDIIDWVFLTLTEPKVIIYTLAGFIAALCVVFQFPESDIRNAAAMLLVFAGFVIGLLLTFTEESDKRKL